jgi:flagellar biosynthesis/type III secretory pathway protein FliH
MALIKQANSAGAAREAIVLNLGDLRREADRLREDAIAERDRILRDARAERDRILEGASERGYEDGYREGFAKGVEQGERDGAEKAYAECAERVSSVEKSLADALESVEAERERVLLETKGDVLSFACAFAERVTKRVVEVDAAVVESQLEAVLKLVLNATRLSVLIHPDDREACDRIAPALSRRRIAESPIEFSEDDTLRRGSVVLRTDKGLIDASVDAQIDRMVELLIGSDRLADRFDAEPSAGDGTELNQ